MKTRPLIFLMAAAWLTFAMKAPAQVSAPDSLAGSFLTVGVRSGYAPFATNGTYRIFISVTGTNYTVLGRAGPLCAGACQYLGTGSLGAATLVDSKAGPGMCLQLSFASATNGTLTLTNANGFQTGVFTLTSYAIPSPPQLFLPGLASGQFQGFLGGQPGFIYAVETSGNLVNWQPSLNRFRDSLQGLQGNVYLNDAYFGPTRNPAMPMPPRGAKPPEKGEDSD